MRVLFILLLFPLTALGMAGVPSESMQCAENYFPNPSTVYLRCTFPRNGSRYNSSNALADQVGVILIPRNPSHKVKIRIHSDGYQPYLEGWPTWNFSDPNYAVIKTLPGHYPNLTDYPGQPLDWGGPFGGQLSQQWRMEALYWYVSTHYGSVIDTGAGIECEGRSYGAATCSNTSLLMPDAFTKAVITAVHADGGPTNFVSTNPLGNYWRDPRVQLAWGAFDYTLADPSLYASPRVYHRYNGGDNDQILTRDSPGFIRDVCEAKRAPCFITWHNNGHDTTQPGINLPFYDAYTDVDMSHRIDQPQIAFTHSSANYFGTIGHYNLGLAWRDGMVNNKTLAIIPLRYLQHTSIGGGVPDQPPAATFDVTLRNLQLNPKAGEQLRWYFGTQSGFETAENGEITIHGLTLKSSATYQQLEITK